MEDHYHHIFNSLFDFHDVEVSSSRFKEILENNVDPYLDDSTEIPELHLNIFNHMIDPFKVTWGENCFKSKESANSLNTDNVDFLLKSSSLLFFINSIIELSLGNQLMLPNTLLYELYVPLKQHIASLETDDLNRIQGYRLLKNMVKYEYQRFNKEFSFKDIDLIDMDIFLELNEENKNRANKDYVLIKNSSLLVDLEGFNLLKFDLQFPTIKKDDYTNIFTIKSSMSTLNVLLNSKGIRILQSYLGTMKQEEVYQKDLSISFSNISTFVLERKDYLYRIHIEDTDMSFDFFDELIETLAIGDENIDNSFIKCFAISKTINDSEEVINVLHHKAFERLTYNNFEKNEGIFKCNGNKKLVEVYQNCDIFEKVINFANSSSSDIFFSHIFEKLLYNRDLVCSYGKNIEHHSTRTYISSVFLLINEKIVGYENASDVFKDLLRVFLKLSHNKEDSILLNHCFECLSRWSHINESYYMLFLEKVFDPSFHDSTSFEYELVEWIESNIKIFDNFLHTISNIKTSPKVNKSLTTTLENIYDCALAAENAHLMMHMMQKCLFYMSRETDEGRIFSGLLLEAVTRAISHSNEHHVGRTISPVIVDIVCLLIDITSTTPFNEKHEKIELHENKKLNLLNSFCKVICFSAFSFRSKDALFLDYDLITEGEMSISSLFEDEYLEFHLLLLKVFSFLNIEKVPFATRYYEILDSMLESDKYRKKIFDNECKIMMSLITVSMVQNNQDNCQIKKLLIKMLKLSLIFLPNEDFKKLAIVLNSDNYESGYRNFAGAYKKWIIFEIFPSLFNELLEVHATLLVENSEYLHNFKTILNLIGTVFMAYKFDGNFLIDFCTLLFGVLNVAPEGKYQTLAAKLLSVLCCQDNGESNEIARLIISNQHIILTENAFVSNFIQIFEFIALNYINTSENKDEKFAFIRIQMSTIENSSKLGILSKIQMFTGGDFPIKNLLNKMMRYDDSEIKKTLFANKSEFLRNLSRISDTLVLKDIDFASELDKKKKSISTDISIAKLCIDSFKESLTTLSDHIMLSESKNLQIRNIDEDDEIEASKKFIDDCDYYMCKIKQSHSFSNATNETFRLKLHRSTNSLMEKKILAPNQLVKYSDGSGKQVNNISSGVKLSELLSKTANMSQNSRVIKKLAMNEFIRHIWNTCIVVGVSIENGVLISTDKNVMFYSHYYFRESEGLIVNRNEMTSEEEETLLALRFEESLSQNKGDIQPEVSISVPKSDIMYSLKRVFLFKDIACEFSDKNNCSYFFTFVNKTMRDSFYSETNTSLVFTSLNHDISKSRNLFEKIFEGINIESNDIINKNGIGAFSFTSKLTSVLHSLVSEDYKLEKITNDWSKGRISNFFYLLAINFYAGRSFNDITQYPIFPWVISNYTSDELDISERSNFRDLSKPMGAQTKDRMDVFRERYNSMQELNDANSPPFHYGTHYSSAMIVASYLIRVEPYTTSFKTLQGGTFGPPDRIFNSLERSWVSASRELTTDVRELIPEFFFLPEFMENVNNIDFGVTQSGTKVENVDLPKWANGSSAAFVYKNLEALESEYVSENLHHWIDLIFGYKQRGQEAVDAVNVFHQLSYSGYTSIKDSVFDDADLASSIIHNFGQTPLQLFITKHPERLTEHFNRELISINKSPKQVLHPSKGYYEFYTLVNQKSPISLRDDLLLYPREFGGLMIEDTEKNSRRQLHGHYERIKKVLYLENYNMLLSLDVTGTCLKWLITEYELIGNLSSQLRLEDIWASDNSGNLLVKTKESECYDLINFNGTVLQTDILKDIACAKVLGFAKISNELKIVFSDIIDYLLILQDNKIEVYRLYVTSRGKFDLKKCIMDVEFDTANMTNFVSHISRDSENESHLNMHLQYQKNLDSNGIINYEL
ncbi:hypothetical protein ACO0OL_001733 [Hanseniaspora opuntiae]